MFILIKSYFGEVLKRLKSLASNTRRSVTRREGSNPSFSAEKGNAKTTSVPHSLFYLFHSNRSSTPHPRTRDKFTSVCASAFRISCFLCSYNCTMRRDVLDTTIIGKAPDCPKSILAKDNNSSPSLVTVTPLLDLINAVTPY